jgi:hypothetical protein
VTDESKSGEMKSDAALAAYPDHAAELREIVQGVARLRRSSRFSVLMILTACVCVLTAILYIRAGRSPRLTTSPPGPPGSETRESDACTRAREQLHLAEQKAAELWSAKEAAEEESKALLHENDRLKAERDRLIASRAYPAPAAASAPAAVPSVPSSAVSKLSGDLPAIKVTGVNGSSAEVVAKVCIDASGHVTSVKLLRALPEIADELQRVLSGWRYKPYTNPTGEVSPACFPVQLRVVFRHTD